MRDRLNPKNCADCGDEMPDGVEACPQCDSDDQRGWSSRAGSFETLSTDLDSEEYQGKAWRWRRFYTIVVVILVSLGMVHLTTGLRLSLVAALAVVGVCVTYIVKKLSSTGTKNQERQLYEELLHSVNGDPAVTERLIEFERHRHPDAPRIRLLADAIERLKYDRSR